jgi:hypothetical protein
MSQFDLLKQLSEQFDLPTLDAFLRVANKNFQPTNEDYSHHLEEESRISELRKIGQIDFTDGKRMITVVGRMNEKLSEKTGKLAQYELAKKVIKHQKYDAGLFIFYDDQGHFRFSLVVAQYMGTHRQFTNFRRYTYFVSPALHNKTFVNQVGKDDKVFSSLENLLKAFSIEAVSNEFYKEFDPRFRQLAAAVQGTLDANLKEDFALLLVIRVIFLGFVQKKKWLGDNPTFIQDFLAEYLLSFAGQDLFYKDWLTPLFFEAFNNAPGYNAYSAAPFAEGTKTALINSPFLNGELFKKKHKVDDMGLSIPDQPIKEFMDFLFIYNFTVEENKLYDEELELNPEFLGLIFERLVNKENGAVYTPRTEVDLMSRLALVKWLELNNTSSIAIDDLYNFMFRNMGSGEEHDEQQKQGDFSVEQIRELISLLENITVCDPAAGSGAFEVGMLHVLAELIENLYSRDTCPVDVKAKKPKDFDLKKAIIANSLYGVEVKRWAVWINHLRLWLSLFVDMPDDFKISRDPLLPNLTFKVRIGDSLVQRVGARAFPVHGHAQLSQAIKTRLTELKKRKRNFFYNQSDNYTAIETEELNLFRAILDTQIDAKHAQITQLMQPKPKQQDWLDKGKIEQMELAEQEDVRQQRITLEAEIANLQTQKTALKEQRPFLWSLEFSEIFIDRGGFDLIIGNPPYVRQEEITDPTGNLDPDEYKTALRDLLLMDFPEYFAKSHGEMDVFKKGHQPDGHSDLYTYFFVRSLRLLNEKGVHVFICSNSWLDVGFGAWLQEFLLRTTPIQFVIDNHAKRSFASSEINTVITVFGAPRMSIPLEMLTRFVAFKKPFEDVIFAEILLAIHNKAGIERNANYRIFPVSIANLLRDGSDSEDAWMSEASLYVGNKWGGIYLRAPDIFFIILEKGISKLFKLSDFASIYPGCYSGINDFFYINKTTINTWNIEEDYYKPLFKSSDDITKLLIGDNLSKYVLTVPPLPKAKLKPNIQKYIGWGERQVTRKRQKTKAGIPWPKTSTVKNRKFWYSIPEKQLIETNIFMQYVSNDRFYCSFSIGKIISDRAFHRVIPLNNTLNFHKALAISLNSSVTALFVMLFGRSNLGQGALKFEASDAKKLLVVSPNIITNYEISDLYEVVSNYNPSSLLKEIGLTQSQDQNTIKQIPNPNNYRRKIDDFIFDILDLSEEERNEVYLSLGQLISDRLNKSKNV